MPIGDPHCECVDLLTNLLTVALAALARVRIQNPVVLDTSLPVPDVSVVQKRSYAGGKPQPADVFLIIEVADTTLSYDRNVKGPTYARNGIPEYWIIDLNSDTVLVHRNPQPDGTWEISFEEHGDQKTGQTALVLYAQQKHLV